MFRIGPLRGHERFMFIIKVTIFTATETSPTFPVYHMICKKPTSSCLEFEPIGAEIKLFKCNIDNNQFFQQPNET
jgi:hypothetical protein